MSINKPISNTLKILLAGSLVFLCYGYICRIADIYFFWESKSIGWVLVLISCILLLLRSVKNKKRNERSVVFERIGIVLITVIISFKLIFMIALFFSDAYGVAKKKLLEDNKLIAEVGNIESFSLIPLGGIQKSTDSSGESGNATINVIVKGKLKYKELTVYLSKNPDTTEWVVDSVE